MEQVAEINKKKKSLESEMAELKEQNMCLTEMLQKAMEEVSELKEQLTKYDKDKLLLAREKARIRVLKSELKGLKWENEVLEQSFSKVQQERDMLHENLKNVIVRTQRKSTFQTLTLSAIVEKKDKELDVNISKKDVEK